MANQLNADVLMSLGPSYLVGPATLGTALEQTGKLSFYHSSSLKVTAFQAGNATADATYIFPTAGPAGNNYVLGSSTLGVLSWINAAGTYAPIGSAFVTIGNDATLTADRALTGTANQVTITDNGANSTVVLSLPQNIHTGASPTFVGVTGTGTIDGQGQLKGKGTTTNDDAAVGYIGEYVSSSFALTNTGASGVEYDATSISLTAGDWDISANIVFNANGATFTSVRFYTAISTTSGNSSTGETPGQNASEFQPGGTSLNGFTWYSLAVPSIRASLSATTTYYLKGFISTFTAGQPQAAGIIAARRRR